MSISSKYPSINPEKVFTFGLEGETGECGQSKYLKPFIPQFLSVEDCLAFHRELLLYPWSPAKVLLIFHYDANELFVLFLYVNVSSRNAGRRDLCIRHCDMPK